MRLIATTLVASSLIGLYVPAASAFLLNAKVRAAHDSPAAQSIARRQYRMKRAIVDTCMSISATVLANAAGLGGAGLGNGTICVCLNDLNAFLDTSVDIQPFINLLGRNAVSNLLTSLMSPLGSKCTLPDHAVRTCVVDQPCAFECDSGYTEQNGQCVCAAPNTECNGQCGSFPNGCGSAAPARKRRSLPIVTLVQAKATCKISESVCGVAAREGSMDFECIDTSSALDSCGGCVTPHPFYEPYRSRDVGQDCNLLPNVLNVGCSESKCVISRCKKGYQPDDDKSRCIPVVDTQIPVQSDSTVFERRQLLPLDLDLTGAGNGVTPTLPSTIGGQIADLANVVLGLNFASDFFPHVNASTNGTIGGPDTGVGYSTNILQLVQTVIKAVAGLLASLTGGESGSLLPKANELAAAAQAVAQALAAENLPPSNPLADSIDAIGKGTLNLQHLLNINATSNSSVNTPITIPGQGNLLAHVLQLISPDPTDNANVGLEALVGNLVLNVTSLQNLTTSNPSLVTSAPGSANAGLLSAHLLDGLVNATAALLSATSGPQFVAGVDGVSGAYAVVNNALDGCGCVEALGLGGVRDGLGDVARSAAALKAWTDEHAIVSPVMPGPIVPNSGLWLAALGIPIAAH